MIDTQPVGASSGPDGTMRVTRKPSVPWKELDGVAIVLVLATGDYFELDEMGLEIWKRLDGRRTLAECADELLAIYDAPLEVMRADVGAFVEELRQCDLVEVIAE